MTARGNLSELDRFEVAGYTYAAVEKAFCFGCIKLLAASYVFILRVIEKQVFYAQIFGEKSRVLCGRVMLFVRVEGIRLCVKAKRLVEKPFAPLGIFSLALAEGLVAAAGELLAVIKLYGKSELSELCRAYVEEFEALSDYLSFLAVRYRYKVESVADISAYFFGIIEIPPNSNFSKHTIPQ